MPPSGDDLSCVSQSLLLDDRELIREREITPITESFKLATYDHDSAVNQDEVAFAKALDDADFVQWWHRNPDRKGHRVRVVRPDSHHYFYPDFVVCVQYDALKSEIRLIETKGDVKDAARKGKRTPLHDGKVIFITNDSGTYRLVDNMHYGATVDCEDLQALLTALKASAGIKRRRSNPSVGGRFQPKCAETARQLDTLEFHSNSRFHTAPRQRRQIADGVD